MQAITLYEAGLSQKDRTEEQQEEWRVKLREIMAVIPGHMQKIAGKSLPFEKYVARKSRRFLAQGCSLKLPGLELGYVFQALPLAPRYALHETHLPQIQSCLQELDAEKEGYDSWWDGERVDFVYSDKADGLDRLYLGFVAQGRCAHYDCKTRSACKAGTAGITDKCV